MGVSPNTFRETKSDATEAAMVERSTSTEKFLCSSSSENSTPAKGALKAAERPALAPQVMRSFSSMRTRWVAREKPFAAMPPSWMEGPSLPSDSPAPMQMAPPAILYKITFHHFWRIWPWISAST